MQSGEREQASAAVGRYELAGGVEIVCQLEGTHAAFEVSAGGVRYALRQFNPYMAIEDLRAQFLLAQLVAASGLPTPVPVPARDGESFVAVEGRLWALFPWCEGRTGSVDRFDDLTALASAQGAWVRHCEGLSSSVHWHAITCYARKLRRRKSWAWVVPLDRVSRFAGGRRVVEMARRAEARGSHWAAFQEALDEAEAGLAEFEALLGEQHVEELPHAITHGDFWVSNLRIAGDQGAVLDLDCFSYEPRITDFARAANWYYRDRSASENAGLFERFQAHARLSVEEAEALPLMMCAHDLYYAVSHVLLFLEGGDANWQAYLIDGIGRESRAAARYRREREDLLSMFLGEAASGEAAGTGRER